LGKIWKINLYNVLPGMMEQHEAITKRLFIKSKQLSPEKEFEYFRHRFHAANARIMTLGGFDSVGDWETWLDSCHQDDEFMQLAKEWYTTINQDSFRTMFWDKKQLL
jgi:hypothetical protein